MSKVRVVIESPLKGDFERNRRYALWCGYHCFTLGEAAYASHLFYPQFLNDLDPEHRKFGIEAGYEWARTADLFAFYTDLGWSDGMLRAKERWAANVVVERQLPSEMLHAFELGGVPAKTPAFEAVK